KRTSTTSSERAGPRRDRIVVSDPPASRSGFEELPALFPDERHRVGQLVSVVDQVKCDVGPPRGPLLNHRRIDHVVAAAVNDEDGDVELDVEGIPGRRVLIERERHGPGLAVGVVKDVDPAVAAPRLDVVRAEPLEPVAPEVEGRRKQHEAIDPAPRILRSRVHGHVAAEARADQRHRPFPGRLDGLQRLVDHPRNGERLERRLVEGWTRKPDPERLELAGEPGSLRRGGRRGETVEIDDVADGHLQLVGAAGRAPARNAGTAVRFVVVGQLLAGRDVARGADPDHVAHDLRVAVGLAVMVDEAGDVAADGCVTHPPTVEDEAPDVPLLEVLPLAAIALLPRDLLAGVVHDPRVLGDRLEREDAPAGNLRAALLDLLEGPFGLDGHRAAALPTYRRTRRRAGLPARPVAGGPAGLTAGRPEIGRA